MSANVKTEVKNKIKWEILGDSTIGMVIQQQRANTKEMAQISSAKKYDGQYRSKWKFLALGSNSWEANI